MGTSQSTEYSPVPQTEIQIASGAPPSNSQQVNILYQEARNYHESKKYKEALKAYKQALLYEPLNPIIIYYRATLFLEEEQFDDALQDFEVVERIAPSSAVCSSSIFNQALIFHFRKKDYKKAIAKYDAVIFTKKFGKMAQVYHNRGKANEDLGNLDAAIQDYTQAIQHDPKNAADIYYARGNLRYIRLSITDAMVRKEDISDCINDLSIAIEMDPYNVKALIKRGQVLKEFERYELAVEDFSTALSLSPNNTNVLFWRALIYADHLNNLPEAIKDYNKIIEIGPEASTATCYFKRGSALLDLGEAEKALKDFEKAAELDPEDTKYEECKQRAAASMSKQTSSTTIQM